MSPLPRRVLYLAQAPFFSGAERALLLTIRSLDPSRYEPIVVAGTDGEFAAQIRKLGIRCRIIPLHQLDKAKPLSTGLSVARVVGAAIRERAAIIHANDVISYPPGGYASRVRGVPVVTHLRFPLSGEAYRWFFRPVFTQAIFISVAFQIEASAAAPGLFDGRSVVLYDAVEMPPVWGEEVRADWRRRLGLPLDREIVALTGQITEVKGIWDFVAAAHRLRSTRASFAVLGDDLRTAGALRRQMETKVAELGLADRFHFLGFRADAPHIVQLFDVIAVPSHVEPFGLASLEAMASGRPVVATRVGGIPEVVTDPGCGILVPPRDPDSLAGALHRLLNDAPLRAALGRAGRERAENRFGLRVHGDAMQDLYDRMIGRPA